MSNLMVAMTMFMETFKHYAGADGDKEKLSKAEVKTLLEKEFNFECPKNPDEVDKLMKGLDLNGDSQIDFREFMVIVVALTCACKGY
ncbi:protein S100-P-like [Dunckerocampus dactyliophorus]|uniref:protein S100-P-like n=1 Tax=Dunckerocampus dactyliophorus TaxID=161453 RepID=UPI002404DDA8|nr:protein S100-P-like [Dunckerocampus dactyliophorus]